MEWFSVAKYGLFVHYGLYAIPGGEWNGRIAPHGAEWLMKNLRIPLREYAALAGKFNPVDFDAEALADSAVKWGMKYLVFTAKHHDGFAMYDSAVSDYSIMHTPYGRDMLREIADACHRRDLHFGIYYSQMQDWEHPDGDGNDWDYIPAEKKFERYFYGKALPQVRELLQNYGAVDLIWFDTPYDMPQAYCRELADTVHTLAPDCLINGRIGYGLGDYRNMADNSIPVRMLSGRWETPMTLNRTWGYSRHDQNWKTASEVISLLVRVAEKGGNLLLNVGPDEKGVIPPASVKILDEVSRWLRNNGDSIFGTGGTPDFPYENRWGHVTCSQDRRTLYLHVFRYPVYPYRIQLTGLKTGVNGAWEIDGKPLEFRQSYEPARDEHRLYVFLPEAQKNLPLDFVVRLSLKDEAEVQEL